jgi:hypothetical protein
MESFSGLILVETKFNVMEPGGMGHFKMSIEWNTKSSLGWTLTNIVGCFVESPTKMASSLFSWLLSSAPPLVPYTT